MSFLAKILSRPDQRALELRDPALIRLFGASSSAAGVNVTEDTALTLSAVYAAVKILSEAIAMLPFHVFERLSDGGRRRADSHPIDELISRRPNRWQTAFEFKELMAANMILRGNGYARIVPAPGRGVAELLPLPAAEVTPRRDDKAGVVFEVRPEGGAAPYLLFRDEVLHWRGLGFDGVRGFSPITVQRETVGNAIAAERYGQHFFNNSATPSGVLEHPGALTPEAKDNLRAAWQEKFGGVRAAGRVAVLEEGMKFNPISISNEDAQFLESKKFNIQDVARIFNVPPHMLAEMSGATFSNIEQQSIDFVRTSLMPWLVRTEEATERDLLTDTTRQGGRFFIKYNVDGMLRGDFAARMAGYAIGRQWGFMSPNDVRRLENMNPLPAEVGDAYLQPLNMVPAGAERDDGAGMRFERIVAAPAEAAARALPAPADAERRRLDARNREERSVRGRNNLRAAHLPLIQEVAGRVIKAQARDIRAAIKRHLADERAEARNRPMFDQWLETYFRDQRERSARTLRPPLETYMRSVAAEVAEEVAQSAQAVGDQGTFIRDYVDGLAGRMAETSRGQLSAINQSSPVETLVADLEARLAEWEGDGAGPSRATKIAGRESVQAANAIATAAYVALGVELMRWRTQGENCPLCRTLEGRVVSVHSYFVGKNEEVGDGEGNVQKVRTNLKHPPLHAGCDCVVVAEQP